MLPAQYNKFTQFAGLGVLGTSYISRSIHFYLILSCLKISPTHAVYRTCGYLRLVQDVAGESMEEAMDEVHTLPDYSTKGEVSALACTIVEASLTGTL